MSKCRCGDSNCWEDYAPFPQTIEEENNEENNEQKWWLNGKGADITNAPNVIEYVRHDKWYTCSTIHKRGISATKASKIVKSAVE